MTVTMVTDLRISTSVTQTALDSTRVHRYQELLVVKVVKSLNLTCCCDVTSVKKLQEEVETADWSFNDETYQQS